MTLCPVCFIFKPRTVSQTVRRVFPCDSGAVADGKFAPNLTAIDLNGLELEPQIESARKAVSLLFDNNRQYFLGKAVSGKIFSVGTIESRFYDFLLRDDPVDYDDRKSAMEVQVATEVHLKDQLLSVVLPSEFLENPAIRDAIINSWNCDPKTYPTFKGSSPSEYYGVVRQIITAQFQEATRI